MRPAKLWNNRFATSEQLRTEQFLSLLQGSANDKIFNDKFFDAIEKRRTELEKLQHTLTLLQLPIYAYLVLVLAGIDVNLSVLGITAGKNLREVLVIASAGLGLWATWLSNEKEAIASMLKARNYRLAKGNKEKLEFLNAGYGLSTLTLVQLPGHWNASKLQMMAIGVLVLATIVLLLALLAFLAAIHVLTLIEVYHHPNFSLPATVAVISFVILADILVADLLPDLPSFIRRVCSGFGPCRGGLQTRSV